MTGRRVARFLLTMLLLGAVAYVVVLDRRVAARFAVGSERLHTRFFSDRLRLERGMDTERVGLQEHLQRLGYRKDPTLAAPGTWRRRGDELEVRARGFTDPAGTLPERTARIRLVGTRVESVHDVATGEQRAHLTLEPAWLGATWNGRWEVRRPIRLSALPPYVAQALLATEDTRFYRHFGVDVVGIARAVVVNLREKALVEGGSTITQQLARSVFLSTARTFRRKLDELVLALILEARLSKDEILELYLNEVYLGRHGGLNVIGYGQAAYTFFGKDAEALTVGEAATLAGIIRAPNPASPHRNLGRALRRRDRVLDRMVAEHMLTPSVAAAAKRAKLAVNPKPPTRLEGAFLLEAARQELERAVGATRVREGGLDVYTTMDPAMQRHAERGVASALTALENGHRWLRGRKTPLESALVIVDLVGGEVRALVGGRDFPRRPFNRAVTARRQAGSTFKPLVYLSAFQRDPAGFTSATLLEDRPLSIRSGTDVWEPVNHDQRFRGPVTVQTALERSLNVPTVRLAMSVGIDDVATTAANSGWQGELPRVPALALGVADTTLLDLVGVYTAFPRLGARLTPHLVRGATGRDGSPAYRRDAPPLPPGDPQASYLVHHLLEGVVDRGTARRLRAQGFTGPLAGKTGTTNDFRDAWFVGYSPDLLAAAWVGFDDGRPVKLPASATALEVWSAALKPIMSARRAGRFPIPAGVTFAEVDPSTGLLATAGCPGIREAFRAGSEPRAYCSTRGRDADTRDFDEPLEAPARLIEGWVKQMMRVFKRRR
ncbi:MAG: transglycosylase domain-containing protein [Candidatus Binatia bacterium]